MSETHEASVKRVLVAIDSTPHGSLLEAAGRLATELRAELHGVFVEDDNLLRLAGLPFASEIDYLSGMRRPLSIQTMEQALRMKAAGARQAIAETAERTSIRWSFRVLRGNLVHTLLTESLNADLLLIGLQKAGLTSPTRSSRGPFMMIDDGACLSAGVLDMARRLAASGADSIVALAACEDDETVSAYSNVSSTCYVQRCSCTPESILPAIRLWRPQLVLIDKSSPLVSESTIDSFIARLPCPLVLVQ